VALGAVSLFGVSTASLQQAIAPSDLLPSGRRYGRAPLPIGDTTS
jgi:hypothetical protein